MINECSSGLGQPKASAPVRVKIETGIICTIIGAQGGGCSFVDELLSRLAPGLDDILGVFADLVSDRNNTNKFRFKVAQNIFDTLELVADGAALLAAIADNGGILATDFCKARPPLPDQQAILLGIAAAILGQPEQLARQAADMWHYENWFKFCECAPPTEPPPPSYNPLLFFVPPSCGSALPGQVEGFYASFAKDAEQGILNKAAIDNLTRPGEPFEGQTPITVSPGGYLRCALSNCQKNDDGTSDLPDRRMQIRYSGEASCNCTGLYNMAVDRYGFYYTDSNGQQLPIRATWINPRIEYVGLRQRLGRNCGGGAKDLKCRDFPELCPCKEVIAEPFIAKDCDIKEVQAVTYLNDKCPTYDMTVDSFIRCGESAPKVISYPYYDPDQSL